MFYEEGWRVGVSNNIDKAYPLWFVRRSEGLV